MKNSAYVYIYITQNASNEAFKAQKPGTHTQYVSVWTGS